MPELSRKALEDVNSLSEQIEAILNREPGASIPDALPARDETTPFISTHLRRRGRDWVTILCIVAIVLGVANLFLELH